MSVVNAYPLSWPPGWKRTEPALRIRSSFKRAGYYSGSDDQKRWVPQRGLSMAEATSRTIAELSRMGVTENDRVISTNVELRTDGTPRSDRRAPADPGVAVYWADPFGQRRCMAVDQYDRVEDNLAAIAATLDAMRAIERHGGAQILERAFTGFTALPAPVTGQKPWREVFGFAQDEAVSAIRLEGAYRTARGEAHPDRPKTGSHEKFLAVQAAYEQAARELGFTA